MIKKKAYFFAEPIEYTIDYQGRYNIPAVHRKTLKIIDASYTKHGFYISASDNNFVRAFPQSYREREIERHLDMPSENKDRLAFFSSKLSYLDAQGRITLPKKFEGLEKAVCVANGDFLDIWKPGAFKKYMESA